jgi:hypothetical protein
MIESHILMSSLTFCFILILVFRLALTLVLCLSSLMDLTFAHMVLVYERTVLCLDALDMAHVLIVMIVFRVCLVFLLDGATLTLSRETWAVHIFPVWFTSHSTKW